MGSILDSRCVGREICQKEMTSLMRRVLIRVANFAQYIWGGYVLQNCEQSAQSGCHTGGPLGVSTSNAEPLPWTNSIASIHISSQFTYLLNPHIFSIHISSQFTYLLNSHIFSITYLLNSHIFFSGDCSSSVLVEKSTSWRTPHSAYPYRRELDIDHQTDPMPTCRVDEHQRQ